MQQPEPVAFPSVIVRQSDGAISQQEGKLQGGLATYAIITSLVVQMLQRWSVSLLPVDAQAIHLQTRV